MSGLLGQILGGMVAGSLGAGARRRGGMGGMVANGLLVALAAKAAQHYLNNGREGRSFDPKPGGGGGLDDLLGGRSSSAGSAGRQGSDFQGGLGGLLGALGGAGALGALLNQLRNRGFSQEVDSWVQPGPNQPIEPHRLAEGLGDDTVDSLAEETGIPRQALLSELSEALPTAVDELTPDGREPSDEDLQRRVQPS